MMVRWKQTAKSSVYVSLGIPLCPVSVGLVGNCPAGLTSLDISADSTVVITGSEDMTAKISNLHTGKVLGTFQGKRI